MTPPAPKSIGSLAIVLHSHMPYVEGFGTYPFGEEWLFDAFVRSHLPVLEVADRLTMTVTPVLADQLEAPGVADRLEAFVREHRLGAARAEASELGAELRPACEAEAARYEAARARLGDLGGDLLEAFRAPAREGRIALMTSAATHAVLPLLATQGGRRLQIDAGLRSHRRRFGAPAGFWLPECAYEAGLEALLAERDLPCFCIDQSATARPFEALAPVATAAGPIALPIDWEAVSWLWAPGGYPAHAAHADSFRASSRGLRLWTVAGDPYEPERAAAVAREQAEGFARAVAERLRAFHSERGRRGLLVFAVDTELLGHWWREGPVWLGEAIRLAARHAIDLVTVPEAIERHEPERTPLHASTWGEGKDLRTWDSPDVADLAWGARRLELRLVRALRERTMAAASRERAARELLAVQASDWAFLDQRAQAGDYPFQRVAAHAEALLEAIHSRRPPNRRLRNLAPDLSLAPLLEP